MVCLYRREVLVKKPSSKIDDVLSGIGREIGGLGYERIIDCYALEDGLYIWFYNTS